MDHIGIDVHKRENQVSMVRLVPDSVSPFSEMNAMAVSSSKAGP